MTRFPDWQARLDRFLNENTARAFAYGSWDCSLFVCDAIQVMTGVDPAESFRDRYSKRYQAMRMIRSKYGSGSVRTVAMGVANELGFERCQPLLAQRGDLILIQRKTDYSLGIVDLSGERIAVLAKNGIWRVPLETAMIAWHV